MENAHTATVSAPCSRANATASSGLSDTSTVAPDSCATAAASGRNQCSIALSGPSHSAITQVAASSPYSSPSGQLLDATSPVYATPGIVWSTADPSMSMAACVILSGSSARYWGESGSYVASM